MINAKVIDKIRISRKKVVTKKATSSWLSVTVSLWTIRKNRKAKNHRVVKIAQTVKVSANIQSSFTKYSS